MAQNLEPLLQEIPALSWSQLRAFEACLRVASFNGAAAALGQTPASVRHQIGLLEARCGAQFFHRLGGRLEPTEAGQKFAKASMGPLRQLARACREASETPPGPVTLTASPLLARSYLFSKSFLIWCERHNVHLDITDATRNLEGPNPIAGIRLGRGSPPTDLEATPLHCPMTLRLAAAPGKAHALRDRAWWAQQVLLTPDVAANAWKTLWSSLDLHDVSPAAAPRYGSYAAALSDAAMGTGLVLAPHPFVEVELEKRRLELLPAPPIILEIGFTLLMRRELARSQVGRTLRRRIKSIFKNPQRPTDAENTSASPPEL